MSEDEKKAIENIKKDKQYYEILESIKLTKYNMLNVEKLMEDTLTGYYTEYEIAQCIIYLLNIIEKYQGIENGTTIIFKAKAKYVREDRIEKYYVDKNKIREKIKELENCVDKPIVKLKVLQHGFTHEANTQFIIKTIINILSEILGE